MTPNSTLPSRREYCAFLVAGGKGILGSVRPAMVHGSVIANTARFSLLSPAQRECLLIFCHILPMRSNPFYF
jgi:hypothetical protein